MVPADQADPAAAVYVPDTQPSLQARDSVRVRPHVSLTHHVTARPRSTDHVT